MRYKAVSLYDSKVYDGTNNDTIKYHLYKILKLNREDN